MVTLWSQGRSYGRWCSALKNSWGWGGAYLGKERTHPPLPCLVPSLLSHRDASQRLPYIRGDVHSGLCISLYMAGWGQGSQ